MGGIYTGIPSNSWHLEWEDASDNMRRFLFAHGRKFDSMGLIGGYVTGGWVHINKATTGIIKGVLHGAYNPNNPENNWFLIAGGSWISTERFLEMAGKIGNNPDILIQDLLPGILRGRRQDRRKIRRYIHGHIMVHML